MAQRSSVQNFGARYGSVCYVLHDGQPQTNSSTSGWTKISKCSFFALMCGQVIPDHTQLCPARDQDLPGSPPSLVKGWRRAWLKARESTTD